PVAIADSIPIGHAGAAQWIDADTNIAVLDCLQVDHRLEIVHIEVHVLMLMGRRGCARSLKRHPRNSAETVRNQSVGTLLDPLGYVSVRGSTMRRIVFEAAESRRIVRRGDDDAVGESTLAASVVAENRMRDYRGGGVTIGRVDHHVDAVSRQHFQCTSKGRFRERVRIETDVKRTVDALLFAVKTNRLGYREDMSFVERLVERAASMPGGSERDALRGDGWIWLPGVVGRHQLVNIDENRRVSGLTRKWADFHCSLSEDLAINANRRGKAWRSRSLPHTGRWYGHSKTFRSRPHSGSPYAPILRSSRIVRRACGRHPDRT